MLMETQFLTITCSSIAVARTTLLWRIASKGTGLGVKAKAGAALRRIEEEIWQQAAFDRQGKLDNRSDSSPRALLMSRPMSPILYGQKIFIIKERGNGE